MKLQAQGIRHHRRHPGDRSRDRRGRPRGGGQGDAERAVTGEGGQALADSDAGDRAAFHAGDVCLQDDVEGFIEHTVATFGRIDGAVSTTRVAQGPAARPPS